MENNINKEILRVRELISNKKQRNITEKAQINERVMGEKLFKQLGITDYIFTPSDGFDKQDGQYQYHKESFLFDIKCRIFPSTKYPTTMIEYSKVFHLQKDADKLNATPQLIIFFNDNKVAMINPDEQPLVQRNITKRKVTEDPYSPITTTLCAFFDLSHPSVIIIDLND